MWNDLRHACRSIRRMPVVSAVVVFSLAAGIGINTVVFSWVQARVLKPIPGVAGGAQVLLIEPKSESGAYSGASWPEFRDLRESLRSFDHVFAAAMVPLYVGEPGAVERVFGLQVSDNYFTALGVTPAAGRFFRADEVAQPGRDPVAVISHRAWQTRFQGAADAIGRPLRVNGRDLTIVGVTPPAFQGTTLGLQYDLWIPATLSAGFTGGTRILEDRGVRGYGVMGRLEPGVGRDQAQAEVDAVMARLANDFPASNTKVTAEVLPFSRSPRGPQRMLTLALALLQAIMLLLLVAVCGNVANLMLARASARQQEMSIRLALGARPRRVAWLLLLENLLLGSLGAAAGALLAVWGTQSLLVLPMTGLPIRFQTSIDLVGLAFAMALGVGCGLLFGAAPALQLARANPQAVLRASLKSSGRSALRQTLMAAQVALAVVVLVVAGLFFRSFLETRSTDPGFRREGVTLAAYDLSGRNVDAAFTRTLAARALDRIRALPFVASAAIASSVPLDIHGLPSRVVSVDGHVRADGGFDEALANTVTPGYFDVMDISLISGTDFADLKDPSEGRQAIVNEEFVARYVPEGEPIGRSVRARGGDYTIIGVVENSTYNAFGEPPAPAIYFSYRDAPQGRGEIHLRVRTGNGALVAAEIGRAMRDVDAELPVFNIRSMDQHVETNLIFRRIPAQMFAVLGPLLLALAAIGISAVVAYNVSLRTREVGLRLALGATPTRVVRTFVGQHLGVAALGGLIGWSAAFMLVLAFAPGGRADASVFVAVPAILLAVAAAACWLPARAVVRVNPALTLRAE